jgi:hypothetical protein
MAEATALSVTLGGTAQTLFPATGDRKVLIYTNTSDEVQYVRIGADAADGVGIYCAPSGGGFVLQDDACPNGLISVIGATTGKKFYAYEGL